MNKFNGVILTGLILLIVGCGGSGDDSPLKVSDLNFNESKIQNCIDEEYVSDVIAIICSDVSGVNDWSDLALLPNLKMLNLGGVALDETPINMDLVYAPNLESLVLSNVNIININIAENQQLKLVRVYGASSLESIDLTANTQLEQFVIYDSPAIKTILTGTMESLTEARVKGALIEEFSIDAPYLTTLSLTYNSKLSSVSLENTPNITRFILTFSAVTYVDFSPLLGTTASLTIKDNPFNDEMVSYIESLIANDIYNIYYQ